MKKSIRNLVIGAVMAAGVLASTATAFAGTQYVQTTMNFRSGASKTASSIGSIPEGAKVEFINKKNDWDLVRYNGKTGYIHAGNLADSYVVKKAPAIKTSTVTKTNTAAQDYVKATKNFYDTTWTKTAQSLTDSVGTWKTVSVSGGYLALRGDFTYDDANELGKLYNGDVVEIQGGCEGSYVFVYSPKLNTIGWVNAGFLK